MEDQNYFFSIWVWKKITSGMKTFWGRNHLYGSLSVSSCAITVSQLNAYNFHFIYFWTPTIFFSNTIFTTILLCPFPLLVSSKPLSMAYLLSINQRQGPPPNHPPKFPIPHPRIIPLCALFPLPLSSPFPPDSDVKQMFFWYLVDGAERGLHWILSRQFTFIFSKGEATL